MLTDFHWFHYVLISIGFHDCFMFLVSSLLLLVPWFAFYVPGMDFFCIGFTDMFLVCFQHVLDMVSDMSRASFRHVLDMVSDMSRASFRHVLDMFQTCFNYFLWTGCGHILNHVLVMFWRVLDMCWTCFRSVLVVASTSLAIFLQ